MIARFLLGCVAVTMWFGLHGALTSAGAQQDMDRIAAVVNDEIISLKELEGRLKIALFLSNLPDSMDNRRRIAPQLIRKMVDERLQLQEANRLKITMGAAEVENGISMIEQNNRLPKGALLARLQQAGLNPALMRDQIKADLTWVRLTTRVLTGQVKVGEEEITDRLDSIRERQGKPEYQLSEIFLPVESAAQEDDMRRLGERLAEQLQAGAPFQALAGQFSRSPTAANGGNMGWITGDALEEELAAALSNLHKGSVSPLIRSASGFFILRLQDQRIVGQTINVDDSVVSLLRTTLPVPSNGPNRQDLMKTAFEISKNWRNCDDMEQWARKNSVTPQRQGPLKLGEIPAAQRRVLAHLPPNRPSDPMDTAEGIQISMVCSRQDATEVSLPSRDQVRRILEDERLDMLSRRYIRDLRRAAFLDLRG